MTCIGCNNEITAADVCCDRCWHRVPDDLSGCQGWRWKLRGALRDGEYGADEAVAAIRHQVRVWLAAHRLDNPRVD